MIKANSKITSAVNPVFSKADNSAIDCTVTFDSGEVYPYTSSANDSTSYGQQLWQDLSAGKYGPIGSYITSSSPV